MTRKRYRLIERRKAVGLSQDRLAEAVGVDRSTIIRWEKADTDPQPWCRPRLARSLMISLDELAGLLAADDTRASAPARAVELPLTGVNDLAALESLRRADRQVGGGHLYATVTSYLQRNIAPRLFGQVPDPDNEPALVAAAGLTEMAGWMAHDAGRDVLARQHFRRALCLAQAGTDPQLVAHIHGSLSHLAHHVRRPKLAMDHADRGLAQLGPSAEHASLQARLLAMQARGHAVEREYEPCVDRLRLAERALAQKPTQPPSAWVSAFDHASLAAEAARCFYALGQPGAARRQAEAVVGLRPRERARSRALARLTLMSALVAQGNPDEACALGRDVLASTRGLGSYVVVRQLEELKRLLDPFRQSRHVASFLAELDAELRERQWLTHWMPPTGEPAGKT